MHWCACANLKHQLLLLCTWMVVAFLSVRSLPPAFCLPDKSQFLCDLILQCLKCFNWFDTEQPAVLLSVAIPAHIYAWVWASRQFPELGGFGDSGVCIAEWRWGVNTRTLCQCSCFLGRACPFSSLSLLPCHLQGRVKMGIQLILKDRPWETFSQFLLWEKGLWAEKGWLLDWSSCLQPDSSFWDDKRDSWAATKRKKKRRAGHCRESAQGPLTKLSSSHSWSFLISMPPLGAILYGLARAKSNPKIHGHSSRNKREAETR